MKKIILAYGIISGVIVIVLSLSIYMISENLAHTNNEWLGYLVMIIALSLIFFGIKSYRDHQQGGVIKFKKALLIGLGISLIASLIYTFSWEVYFQTVGSDFAEKYEESQIKHMAEQGATETELESVKAQMAKFREIYKVPVFRMGITLMEIFPVGLLITLVSATLLRKSNILPHPSNLGNSAG